MAEVFPESVKNLPLADIPVPGLTAYLSQGPGQQILFMEFEEDIEIPSHAHEAQWSVVLEGRIELEIEGGTRTYTKGDRILVPKGARHSARIHAGYADITFFDEPNRYQVR
jgi:quercetin dioxygenase-like cupin family protein